MPDPPDGGDHPGLPSPHAGPGLTRRASAPTARAVRVMSPRERCFDDGTNCVGGTEREAAKAGQN